MAKKKSAAPSGLSISRDGLKFTISWKIPAKKYEDGQWLWYRLHTKNAGASKWDWTKWKKIDVGKSATKKTVALDAKNYYPVSSKLLNAIEFKVKGKTKSDKKHTYTAAHSTKTFTIYAPNAPSVLILLMILAQIKVPLLGAHHTRRMMRDISQKHRYRLH